MNDIRAQGAAAVRLLLLAVMIAFTLHFYFLPAPPDREALLMRSRANLAAHYRGYQQAEGLDVSSLLPHLDSRLALYKQARDQETITEAEAIDPDAVAVIYAVEGQKEELAKLLDEWPGLPRADVIRYAAGLSETLPGDWKTGLPDDLFGTHLTLLVYKRSGNEASMTEATFRLRHQESSAARKLQFDTLSFALKLLGLGFMLSMYFSARQFRRMKRPFFLLTPLFVPYPVVLRFLAVLLGASVTIHYGIPFMMPSADFWLQKVIIAALQVGTAIFLLKAMVFPAPEQDLFRSLGLGELRMHFLIIFQVIGGLAILHGCKMFASDWAVLTPWPLNRTSTDSLAYLAEQPLAGGLYVLVCCVLLAVVKEVIFRGLVFRSLLSFLKPWKALFLSAALYAVFDPLASWPVSFGLGFGFALVYYRNANLLTNIWVHTLWNCSAVILVLMEINV